MSKFSVVIINYNGKKYLRRCLESLKESSAAPEKIIVVDDASTDGSQDMLKENYSEHTLVFNSENQGPVKARNTGAKKAEGDYIVFMDNDVRIQEDAFLKLVDFLEENKKTGACSAWLTTKESDSVWWNAGYDPNNFRESIGYIIGFFIRIFPNADILKKISRFFILNYITPDEPLRVDWVRETCFAVRRGVFEKVDGFDEDFYMFFEGPDLCKRIREEGYKVYLHPGAKVDLQQVHTHTEKERMKWRKKSKYRFYKKHYFYLKSNLLLFWIGNAVSGLLFSQFSGRERIKNHD